MATFHLNKIHIQNFRSIRDVELEIKDGLYAIIGKNTDQPASFNGAGKSSCIYALWWCLTGSSLGGEVLADDVVNVQEGKNCRVECVFDTDQGEIVIMRCRKDKEHGNNLFLTINGQDVGCHKIAETQERINQLLKVNFDVLKSTIIMTSDMKSRFSELTPQARVSLLESIRDYTIWEKVRAESNIDIKDLEQKIKTNEADANQIQGSINAYNQLVSELRIKYIDEKNKVTDENPEEKINNLKQLLDIKQKELEACTTDSFGAKIQDLEGQKNKKNTLIQEKLIQHNQNNTNINEKYKKESDKLNEEIQTIQNQISEINANILKIDFDIKTLKTEENTINKWFTDDTCPTCHRKLDRTKQEIDEKTQQKVKISQNIEEKESEKNNITQKVEILSKNKQEKQSQLQINNEKCQKELDEEKNKHNKEIEIIQDEIKALDELKTEQNKLLTDITNRQKELNDEINQLNNKINVLKEQNKSIEEKLNEIQKQAEIYKKQVEEFEIKKDKFIKENEKLEKQKQYVKFFYDSLGPKGNFRGILLAQDIAYINKCIKNYTPKFFSGVDLYLTTPSMDKNVIDIIFEEDGVIKPVSNLSSGERKRVDLQIQMAIYDLVQSTSLFNFNLCVFDEIESALDPEGVRQLLEVIDDRQDNFQTAWWITNNETVSSNILNKIVATKKNGFTKVEYM